MAYFRYDGCFGLCVLFFFSRPRPCVININNAKHVCCSSASNRAPLYGHSSILFCVITMLFGLFPSVFALPASLACRIEFAMSYFYAGVVRMNGRSSGSTRRFCLKRSALPPSPPLMATSCCAWISTRTLIAKPTQRCYDECSHHFMYSE